MSVGRERELAVELGLLEREYDVIEAQLGRAPNASELTVFAGMWSEHCAYKSTRQWLGRMPQRGPRVLAGPGSHAGVVDVGEGWAIAFKMESHNHPSAVEPYQGAATGVGGILRDVIAQGARPCAVLDSLCFGAPTSPANTLLRDGVVAGIGGYGNAFGVPNIGGATTYDRRYEGNPLVNALAAGLVRPEAQRTAVAKGVGNLVLLVGATTGRDGVLGAAFASEALNEDTAESRSHVQVGDPFAGKRLCEACLSFTPEQGLVACQDLGASGIACAAFEMAAAGDMGMRLWLDAVPLREAEMTPHEILVSESQERFMFIVDADYRAAALEHFRAHGVHAAIIGELTGDGRVQAVFNGTPIIDLPAALVAEGSPLCDWPVAARLPEPEPYPAFTAERALGDTLLSLLADPNVADPGPDVYAHYDQTVGNRTVRAPGEAEAGVQKLPHTQRGYALCITGRGALCAADPYAGAQAALAEAYRRLACCGAEMVAITDGLNCGSPRAPLENRRIERLIAGLADGLQQLEVPVTGGNVSLYNSSAQGDIPPTPMVGALGLVPEVSRVPPSRIRAGDVVLLAGEPGDAPVTSLFADRVSGALGRSRPHVDLAAEQRLAQWLCGQVAQGHVRGTKACTVGGLAVALAKLCVRSAVGLDAEMPARGRWDWTLFGEWAAMALVAVTAESAATVLAAATAANVPVHRLGVAQGDALHVRTGGNTLLRVPIAELRAAHGREARSAQQRQPQPASRGQPAT